MGPGKPENDTDPEGAKEPGWCRSTRIWTCYRAPLHPVLILKAPRSESRKTSKIPKSPGSGKVPQKSFPGIYAAGFRLIRRGFPRAITWWKLEFAAIASFREKLEKPEKIRKSPKIRTLNPDISKPLWIEPDVDPSFFIGHHTASACQI